MATDNLAFLSRKVLVSPLGKDGNAFLSHDDYRKQTAALPAVLRDQIDGLMESLREVIPNDFSFSLACEFAGMRLSMNFEDGNTGSFGGGSFFTSRKSMMAKLRRIDWDKRRGELIEQSKIFEEMQSAADDRPAKIPSSEEAARRYQTELTAAFEEVRAEIPVPDFVLMIGRDDAEFGVEALENRDDIVHTIADRMTTGCDILAVLERGVAWSFGELEAIKLEAVDVLGPISRAKAERRFFP